MMQTRAKTQFKADSFRASGFGDKALDVVIFALVALAVLVTAYPFLYVVSVSISDGAAVARGDVLLFPKGFSLDAFSMVLKYDQLCGRARRRFHLRLCRYRDRIRQLSVHAEEYAGG